MTSRWIVGTAIRQHTIGLRRGQGQRDGKTIDQNSVLVFSITDGLVSEVREFHENTAESDSFWS